MLQPKAVSTFEEYFDSVFAPYILRKLNDVKRLDIVWDVYKDDSLKKATREKRGSGQRRKVLLTTRIPSDWKGFLRVDDNKDELFKLLSTKVVRYSFQRGKKSSQRTERAFCVLKTEQIGKKSAWDVWKVFPELTHTLKALMMLPEDIDEACMGVIERFVVPLYDRTSSLRKVNEVIMQELFQERNTQDNPHEEEMADLIYYSVCKMLPYKTYVYAYELYPKHTLLPRDRPLGTHSVVNILP
ncbi:hypothetical protein ACROYT_G040774 [Oculina patagonica]